MARDLADALNHTILYATNMLYHFALRITESLLILALVGHLITWSWDFNIFGRNTIDAAAHFLTSFCISVPKNCED